MIRPISMSIAALLWMSLMAFVLATDGEEKSVSETALPAALSQALPVSTGGRDSPAIGFRLPYDQYEITQGLHGFEYGHAAIDLGAGEGAPLFAPISGTVVLNTVDGLQNTILVIESERYVVTLMHGIYSVSQGEEVAIGDPIGSESNQGNTQDYDGVPCFYNGRDCGYHTHLNVFDRVTGQNLNPLALIE